MAKDGRRFSSPLPAWANAQNCPTECLPQTGSACTVGQPSLGERETPPTSRKFDQRAVAAACPVRNTFFGRACPPEEGAQADEPEGRPRVGRIGRGSPRRGGLSTRRAGLAGVFGTMVDLGVFPDQPNELSLAGVAKAPRRVCFWSCVTGPKCRAAQNGNFCINPLQTFKDMVDFSRRTPPVRGQDLQQRNVLRETNEPTPERACVRFGSCLACVTPVSRLARSGGRGGRWDGVGLG